ncbi:YndJ family protein [Lysinibacillus sp. FSL W8-0992]|uniref:YndJ family protein n=1 Tax=Lysinibacillus sp. FSL W8-0992 TaxID=2954643 RepID=UPI0030FC47DF
MLANLRKHLFSPVLLIGWVLIIICYLFSKQPDYLILLTFAQLVLVPAMLKMVVAFDKKGHVIIIAMMLAVTLLHWLADSELAIYLAVVYVLYTAFIALQGLIRFLQRGFTNTAEIAIDIGLIYIFIGGLWFFAYIAEIDTGFSPLITWLTAIHFHYSACLLAISIGLFGRIHKSKGYNIVVLILLTGPLLVALGITFSTIIEIVSVALYIGAIYWLFTLSLKTSLPRRQGLLLRISYGSLCLTILWSLLYAFGNFTGIILVSIPDMLTFHGLVNCLLFGLVGVIAWGLEVPKSTHQPFTFPVSRIRGKLHTTGDAHAGLVDALQDFVDTRKLPQVIPHFYEQTNCYRLNASVQWRAWFKPLAFIYQGISRWMQQLNLPLTSKQVEMNGVIVKVDERQDGRHAPRAWIRKIDEQTTFVAIYSQHTTAQTTYMNIALPLPFSTMIGILYVYEKDGELHITSSRGGDAGIYLAMKHYVFRLPLNEHFTISAKNETTLSAVHTMRIFGLPFLRIDYQIEQK